MDIFEQQAKQIAKVRESAKVVPFPTPELARELHAQGKVLVHKPASLKSFHDDEPPLDAA
jgi:hypothetical protein